MKCRWSFSGLPPSLVSRALVVGFQPSATHESAGSCVLGGPSTSSARDSDIELWLKAKVAMGQEFHQ